MFKVEAESGKEEVIVPISKMKPYQIGIIVDTCSSTFGHYVMRTPLLSEYEMLDLTDVKIRIYRGLLQEEVVRLLNKGEKLILTVE